MEPQSALREGENKCSSKIKRIQSTMLEKAYRGLMMNIMTRVPSRPMNAVYHVKYLNEGLKNILCYEKSGSLLAQEYIRLLIEIQAK